MVIADLAAELAYGKAIEKELAANPIFEALGRINDKYA
jgi:hypothetical protein